MRKSLSSVGVLVSAIAMVLSVAPSASAAAPAVAGGYRQINLISDIPGVARITDPHLVNPWGMSALPGGPLWVSDNGDNSSTLYTGADDGQPLAPALPVAIPAVHIPGGAPTGQVANSTPSFVLHHGTAQASSFFIFASESGNISGWAPFLPPLGPNGVSLTAHIVYSDPTAVYKGLAIDTTPLVPLLYAADFANAKIDVFDPSFHLVDHPGRFVDKSIPDGYAPFNIANLGGRLYVTYAKQDAAKEDDVAGPGHGFVDVYSLDGVLQQRLVRKGALNSPWGLAMGSPHFGAFTGDLLVGNFGDGKIDAYDPTTGAFLGALTNGDGNPIQIQGLWGLQYGNEAAGGPNKLFFTAGIADEAHGLMGSITPLPDTSPTTPAPAPSPSPAT